MKLFIYSLKYAFKCTLIILACITGIVLVNLALNPDPDPYSEILWRYFEVVAIGFPSSMIIWTIVLLYLCRDDYE